LEKFRSGSVHPQFRLNFVFSGQERSKIMCRGSFIGGLIMAVILGIGPAMAQTPKLQLQPRLSTAPPPKIIMMPPAMAGQLALRLHPGATLLKINPLQGSGYAVTIRQGNAIKRVVIPNNP
jgi:hypothetical protein